MDIVLVGVVLLAGYYVIKSGVLNQIGQPVAGQPITTAPVEGEGDTTTTPTTTTPTTTTPTTTTPTTPVDPLQALIDQLLGTGGSNTLPTQPGAGGTLPPAQQQPVYQGNPAECSSRYNGKCDTECKSGNTSLCQSCMMACGGAAVGAVQTLPPTGATTNPALCSSKYNGKCNTECSSGNSSECQQCKQACGSFNTYAYYVKTPTNLMASSVFRNSNYSSYANWQINVQNAK